jgi:SAM-dependent methyltransferase
VTGDGLSIDLGCGGNKKPGTVGIDVQPLPGVDLVVDLETEALPFGDETVAYVHASHVLEHLANPTRLFTEISRVCREGARLEFWMPYAGSNPGFVLGHKTFFTEDVFLHICCWYVDFWHDVLHVRWVLDELQYVVDPQVLVSLHQRGIDLAFAIKHFRNVATEFGARMTVYRRGAPRVEAEVAQTFSTGRFEPRYRLQRYPLLAAASDVAEALRRFGTPF